MTRKKTVVSNLEDKLKIELQEISRDLHNIMILKVQDLEISDTGGRDSNRSLTGLTRRASNIY